MAGPDTGDDTRPDLKTLTPRSIAKRCVSEEVKLN
jgi:hypothetical protein